MNKQQQVSCGHQVQTPDGIEVRGDGCDFCHWHGKRRESWWFPLTPLTLVRIAFFNGILHLASPLLGAFYILQIAIAWAFSPWDLWPFPWPFLFDLKTLIFYSILAHCLCSGHQQTVDTHFLFKLWCPSFHIRFITIIYKIWLILCCNHRTRYVSI